MGAPEIKHSSLGCLTLMAPSESAVALAEHDTNTFPVTRSVYLGGAVSGRLHEVHSVLGPGLIHRVDVNALYYELQLRGLAVEAQREMQVAVHGQPGGEIQLNHIEVEGALMALPMMVQDVSAVNLENLWAWMSVRSVRLGVVVNFGGTGLEFAVVRG